MAYRLTAPKQEPMLQICIAQYWGTNLWFSMIGLEKNIFYILMHNRTAINSEKCW